MCLDALRVSVGSRIQIVVAIGFFLLLQPCLAEVPAKRTTPATSEHLRLEEFQHFLRRMEPTAKVTAVSLVPNMVMLTGTVAAAEDANMVVRIAQTGLGAQVINALRVRDNTPVQLDVVILQAKAGIARNIVRPFLESPEKEASVSPTPQGFSGVLKTKRDCDNLLAIVESLKREGLAKVLAQPTVVTCSGTAGTVLVGGEQAVPVPAGLGQVGVQFEEFGTRLNYLPIVLGDGKIHLEFELEVSSLSTLHGTNVQGIVAPGRVTSRVRNTLELSEGQTIVLVARSTEIEALPAKSPQPPALPFLPEPRRKKEVREIEVDSIILVTPRVLPPDARDCAHCR